MKLSKFNSIVELSKDYNLLYNALSNSFFLARKNFKLSVDKLTEVPEKLINNGFVIEESVDEGKILKERITSIIHQEDHFHLTINPTLECNFSCWYCYEEKKKGAVMKETTLLSVETLIRKLGERYKSIHIAFFGGEPLLYFDKVVKPIYDCIEMVCEKTGCNYSTSFTTNGSLLTSKVLSFLSRKNVVNMQITIDGGRDWHNRTRFFANKKGSYNLILNNIAACLQKNIAVILRINYTPENIDSLSSLIDYIVDFADNSTLSLLTVRFHQVWQTTEVDLSSRIDELIEVLISHGIRALKPIFNNVYNPCYADFKNGALINFNGDVFRCTAIDFLNTQRDGVLTSDGEIIWENDSFQRRLDSRINNTACDSCRIQPICNGGCSQKVLSALDTKSCLLGFSEERKDQIIRDRFVTSLHMKQLQKDQE